ncbi:hypothetical protein ACJMK2_035937 [Sinanodonta woodiana]|uniref:ABC transporter domain-containing protein n=1 Tax=Sinanodonta woodiana TaxID=1069815 RepID=A0ABD3WHM3_SINWO
MDVVVFSKNQVDVVQQELDETRTLSLHHVSYVVKQGAGPWWKGACLRPVISKTVLNQITMQLKSGQITALLGNSGSGKTSLLDVISYRSSGSVTGKVYYNNHEVTKAIIQDHASYVMQADRLLPNLTVRETLLMLLTHGSEVKIIRGISGGERRRVTIAIQLLQNPDIVLLDEPTSGLDSHTARHLVKSLADMAHNGKIVLLTIHQPSSDIFKLLDQVAILTSGELTFCGGTNELVPYFSKLGYPCPHYMNPLDHYIDLSSIDRRDPSLEVKTTERQQHFIRSFIASSINIETERTVLEDTLQSSNGKQLWSNKRTLGLSYLRVIYTIISRMNVNLFRDRKDYCSRIFFLPLYMLFILIFLGRLGNKQSSIQDRVGLMYQSATVPPFIGLLNAVALFPVQRNIFYRECRDGLYSIATFLIAYTVHIFPFLVLSTIIFSSIIYWVTGLYPTAERFGLYTATIFFLQLWGETLTVLFLGIFLDPNLANSTTALIQTAAAVIASGLLKNVATLVKPLEWLSWGFIHKYSGEILIANEFQDLEFSCESLAATCIPNGTIYLDLYYPESPDHMKRNFAVISSYCLWTLIFAMVAFKIRGIRNLY